MTHPYLNDVRRLFERSEGETDPHRKFVALEEALDLVDLVLEDSSLPQSDRELATNLRRSNIRRLFSQLDGMRDIQFGEWFKYLDMLNTRCENEIKTVLDEDSPLTEGYKAFVALWLGELLESVERLKNELR